MVDTGKPSCCGNECTCDPASCACSNQTDKKEGCQCAAQEGGCQCGDNCQCSGQKSTQEGCKCGQ